MGVPCCCCCCCPFLFQCVKENVNFSQVFDCIWPFLKSHLDYWWCFDDNIENLGREIQGLDRQTYDVQQRIVAAGYNAGRIRPGVQEWLEAHTEKVAEGRRILAADIPKKWNLISRYSMGKSAKKAEEKIANHRNDGNFITISDSAHPACIASTSQSQTMNFESRRRLEEQIMESLKNSSISTIAICGMGGVGKTSMADRIGKRVKEENLFDEVVKVTISQKIDMPKIQNEIAELLGLKFDVESISARAHQLRTRLIDRKRKIIILDDVWESLGFEDLGIPIESNFERCKVLMTSRSRDTCKRIKSKKVFELEILKNDEAWLLFKDKAGDCVEDFNTHPVAKDVAAECKGLPIALVTVGLALQDETDIRIWKHALSKLKESKPTDLPEEIMTHVYGSLELSYEKLGNRVEKMFFLMCCLFPEDYDIPLQYLTWYSMGLRLFDDISIEEATNRMHSLVGKLKSRFLLIDGTDKLHVKMHDVVRDVAIYIGSKEKDGFLKSLHRTSIENSSDVNCNWLSVDISNERMEVPALSRFPKLRLLRLSSNEFYDISHISFEGIEDLNVLSFQRVSIGSVPPKLGSLKNLQTLHLFDCEVENISVIGELTGLEIFSCYGCENIMELPAEIGRLKGLRLLELNECSKLQRIPFGIISSLVKLEELKIISSFRGWEAEENGKEWRNASLRELECLPNLSCLEIEIDDCTLSAQEICLSQKLVKYYICIGSQDDWYYQLIEDYDKVMILNLPSDIGAVGKWIQKLVRNTEFLYLQGDGSGSNNFNIAETECLRNLRVVKCSTVKKLDIIFRSLERLDLDELKNLEEIQERTRIPNQNVSLCNLKFIKIRSCPKLRSLFSVSVARRCLLQLEVLHIGDCAKFEQVFWNEIRDETDDCIEFPKLKKLRLQNLQNLTAFFQGLENIVIKFPNLTDLEIGGLPNLNSLSPLNSETVIWHDHNTCFHFVCNPKVEMGLLKDLRLTGSEDTNIRNIWCHQIPNNVFNNLETLRISKINGIRSLMSTSIVKNLVSLKVLNIQNCTEMVEVIEKEDDDEQVAESLSLGGDGSDNINLAEMDNLRNLEFTNSSTVGTSYLNQNVSLCNLTSIEIRHCPKLRSLFSGSMATRCFLQLEVLVIAECDSMEQVFWNDIRADNTDGCIEFPKLKELQLWYLQNLTAFFQGLENIIIKFPNLTDMDIGGLPKLNSLSPLNSETVVRHDQNTCFHFVCNPKVEMGSLETLSLFNFGDNIRNIWCLQIPNNIFNNLKTLHIHSINGIRSLVSTSIVKNFVSLKVLQVWSCREIVEVIEKDDDDNKQVVDHSSCLFPNLRDLSIQLLPKLRWFWQWNHALKLPLLESVLIQGCPVMETFTLGSINAPNIRNFNINWIQITDQKDLNDAIRQCYKTRGRE